MLDREILNENAAILKAISHPIRLAILRLLSMEGAMPVNTICSVLKDQEMKCEQSLVSHHLSNMRAKGLLKADKQGTKVFYSLDKKHLERALSYIKTQENGWVSKELYEVHKAVV